MPALFGLLRRSARAAAGLLAALMPALLAACGIGALAWRTFEAGPGEAYAVPPGWTAMGKEEVERRVHRSLESGLPADLEALALHPRIRFFAYSPGRDAALAVWVDEVGGTLPAWELIREPESRAATREEFRQVLEGLGESMRSRDAAIRFRILRADFHPEDESVLIGEARVRRGGREQILRVWWRYETDRVMGLAALGDAPVEEFLRRSGLPFPLPARGR